VRVRDPRGLIKIRNVTTGYPWQNISDLRTLQTVRYIRDRAGNFCEPVFWAWED